MMSHDAADEASTNYNIMSEEKNNVIVDNKPLSSTPGFRRVWFSFAFLCFSVVRNIHYVNSYVFSFHESLPPNLEQPQEQQQQQQQVQKEHSLVPLQHVTFPVTRSKDKNLRLPPDIKYLYHGTYNPHTRELRVEIDHNVMFFRDGQTRLCEILDQMTDDKGAAPWKQQLALLNTNNNNNSTSRIPNNNNNIIIVDKRVLQATIDCTNPYNLMGQGNWITSIYAVRVASALAGVDFSLECQAGTSFPQTYLVPWYTGYRQAPAEFVTNPWNSNHNTNNNSQTLSTWNLGYQVPTREEVCRTTMNIRIDTVIHEMINDTRAMVANIQNNQLTIDDDDNDIDDVVIHFRCGDIFGGRIRKDIGIIHFSEYHKHIRVNETRTVGILTQPFVLGVGRQEDAAQIEPCKNATYHLVHYLQSFLLPDTTITIRNNVNETLPLAYARLVLAKQAIISISSFGIFPLLASYGDRYFQKGNEGFNAWANHLVQHMNNNNHTNNSSSSLTVMKAPYLSSGKISRWKLERVLQWLVE